MAEELFKKLIINSDDDSNEVKFCAAECRSGIIDAIKCQSSDNIDYIVKHGNTGDSYTFYTDIFFELVTHADEYNKTNILWFATDFRNRHDQSRFRGVCDLLLELIWKNKILDILLLNDWIFNMSFTNFNSYRSRGQLYANEDAVIAIIEHIFSNWNIFYDSKSKSSHNEEKNMSVIWFISGALIRLPQISQQKKIVQLLIDLQSHNDVVSEICKIARCGYNSGDDMSEIIGGLHCICQVLSDNGIAPPKKIVTLALISPCYMKLLRLLIINGVNFNEYAQQSDYKYDTDKEYAELISGTDLSLSNYVKIITENLKYC